jgi:NAD kinase
MRSANPGIAIVTRATRMEGLREKWGTAGAARFRMQAAHEFAEMAEEKQTPSSKRRKQNTEYMAARQEADFLAYRREADVYEEALQKIHVELDFGLPIKTLDRGFVPRYDFSRTAVVIVVGQDGLVANVAKYVGGLPIVAINPDPERIDGVLLPFQANDTRRVVKRVLDGKYASRNVTLAEARLNDGQKLVAFNDLFIGAASHVSARYTIRIGDRAEPQSSSGVLISTGAGSTGWMSSVFNMAIGIASLAGAQADQRPRLEWEDTRLLWAVREPFLSKTSRTGLIAGVLPDGGRIVLESLMPAGGVIFSDGVEADFLHFNSGVIAEIGASALRAKLVVG